MAGAGEAFEVNRPQCRMMFCCGLPDTAPTMRVCPCRVLTHSRQNDSQSIGMSRQAAFTGPDQVAVIHAQVPAPAPSIDMMPWPVAIVADLLAPAPAPLQQLAPLAASQGPLTADASQRSLAADGSLGPHVTDTSQGHLSADPAAPASGPAVLPIGSSTIPAGVLRNASFTTTAAADSSAPPLNGRQIAIITAACVIVGIAFAAAILLTCWRWRQAARRIAPTQPGRSRASAQTLEWPGLGHELRAGHSGALSLPDTPSTLRPLQLRPAARQDKPAVQMRGGALLPTHISPAATPTSAGHAQPVMTHLVATSTVGEAPRSAWGLAAAGQGPQAEEEKQPPLAALQLDAERESHLLQPTPLTRRWTWQVGPVRA